MSNQGQFLFIARNGSLVRVAVADGAAQGFSALHQPVIAGPVAYGNDRLVVADDGTVLVVNAATEATQ